jgi:putative tryptophan/tyrosine transport system substrate-binding protein
MRRREFLGALGGAAMVWPLAARTPAQAQQRTPVIGVLNSGSPDQSAGNIQSLRKGLAEAGYVEGQNLTIDFRWSHGRYDVLPALAAELVRDRVALIVAGGTAAPALAAKAATATIPIVFTSGDDPVKIGLVPNLNRPGGNVTGVHIFLTELSAKKLGLLRDLVPQVAVIGLCLNPSNRNAKEQLADVQAAARDLGLRIEVANAANEHEIDQAFATLAGKRVGAVVVSSDPFYFTRRSQLIGLAARHAIPAVYPFRTFVDDGGLMSYGTSITDAYRQAGVYAGRVLKGERPADLPVVQSTKFELVINLKTAKALGLKLSPPA